MKKFLWREQTSPAAFLSSALAYPEEKERVHASATLDWSRCPAVESIPGKVSGAWVFKGTGTPVSTVFENLQDMGVDEPMQEFGVTREQVHAVLQFAADSTFYSRPTRISSYQQNLKGRKIAIVVLGQVR